MPKNNKIAGRLVWPEGRIPRQFQLDAALWSLARPNTYLALEQGLGKSIVAALIQNAVKGLTLYVCPTFMVLNMQAEMARWLTADAGTVTTGRSSPPTRTRSVWIIGDNQLTSTVFLANLRRVLRAVRRQRAHGCNIMLQLMVDEAQRFNQPKTQRTRKLLQIAPYFDRAVLMSGTPMPNRPIELYTLVSHFAPEAIGHMTLFRYARKYCAAHKTKFGWDFTGASNLPDLRSRLKRSFMLRLEKKDVLKDLPPKTEELLLLDGRMPPHVAAMDAHLLRVVSTNEKAMARSIVDRLNAIGQSVEGLQVATYRRELGLIKVPLTCKYLSACLEEEGEAILVFAIHKEVIQILARELKKYQPLIITGATKASERQAIVTEFQKNPTRRLLIGNVQAAGVGHTMTKASRVFFVEFSWNPADNDQASDRAHRIGQRDHVYVQYAVLRNSLDRRIIEALLDKRVVTKL